MLKVGRLFVLFTLFLLFASAFAHAINIRGKVLNGTTRRPSAGDEVVLLRLSQDGMSEVARTQTDTAGHFVLAIEHPSNYVVRVIHQGVTYHKPVDGKVNEAAVDVYDVVQSLESVRAVMDVQRFEATHDTLEIKQLITMRNHSKPPRTLSGNRPFEIQLPPDAQIESGMIQIGTSQPLKNKPTRGERDGQYYFNSPLRPGDTRFAIVYRLPYNGEATIEPQIRNPQERFVVMLPKSMRFEARAEGKYSSMMGTTADNVQGATALNTEDVVAFQIAGRGALEEFRNQRERESSDSSVKGRLPGGGLGPPIDGPDPLREYRVPIFASIVVLMTVGATCRTKMAHRIAIGSEIYHPLHRGRNSRRLVKHKAAKG